MRHEPGSKSIHHHHHHYHQVSCSAAGAVPPCVEPIKFTNLFYLGWSLAGGSASASDKPTCCRSLAMASIQRVRGALQGLFQPGAFASKWRITCIARIRRCAARRYAGSCWVRSCSVMLEILWCHFTPSIGCNALLSKPSILSARVLLRGQKQHYQFTSFSIVPVSLLKVCTGHVLIKFKKSICYQITHTNWKILSYHSLVHKKAYMH